MRKRPSRPGRIGLETLEGRATPATFGLPWSDPGRLSLSYAPDATPSAGAGSSLFAELDAVKSRQQWQRDVARAIQTWAVQANINISVRPDSGAAFGATGFAQNDPRFGDLRVGAHPMSPDVLAVSMPHDPAAAGTLSGDISLNSDHTFDGNPYDLFSVMLQETGHALGLDNSSDPESPMYNRFNNTKTQLTAGDIAALRELYGSRIADEYEGLLTNNLRWIASPFRKPSNYQGETPLVAFGDVTATWDVDYYVFHLPEDFDDDDRFTVRLRTSGLSLLAPKVAVLDKNGSVLASATGSGAAGSVLNVSVPFDDDNDEGDRYYIKVSGAVTDAFGVGNYGLAVRFDPIDSTSTAAIDNVLTGAHRSLDAATIDALFRNPGGTFLRADGGSDEGIAAAQVLTTAAGFAAGVKHEAIASIETATDRDVYQFRTPSAGRPVVSATVWTTDPRGLVPRLELFDATGTPVVAEVIASLPGRFALQVRDVAPNSTLFVRVADAAGGVVGLGNYALSLDATAVASQVQALTEGTVEAAAPVDHIFYVARTQLFQFVQSATGNAGGAVRTTIRDLAGQELFALQTAAGDVTGSTLLIKPGEYRLRVAGLGAGPLGFQLRGLHLSDPIGPTTSDPTMTPIYLDPLDPLRYLFPGGASIPLPYRLLMVAG